MINVLFVDDEPNIFQGLERMLRSVRHEWQMSFARSGAEALVLKEKKIDVIVSDMKMPGMDGSELLQIVSETHVVRVILSGFSDKEVNMRSVQDRRIMKKYGRYLRRIAAHTVFEYLKYIQTDIFWHCRFEAAQLNA